MGKRKVEGLEPKSIRVAGEEVHYLMLPESEVRRRYPILAAHGMQVGLLRSGPDYAQTEYVTLDSFDSAQNSGRLSSATYSSFLREIRGWTVSVFGMPPRKVERVLEYVTRPYVALNNEKAPPAAKREGPTTLRKVFA